MSKKLQNIKAVKQMLDGTHKFQTKKTIGFSDAEHKAKKNQKRNVGDTWEEKIGNTIYTIEQKEGFRVKHPKNAIASEVRKYLESYPNCRESCCKTSYNHLDKKMRILHGMCSDLYEEYEKKKIRNNKLAWLKKAEQDVEALKKAYTESKQYVTNADGQLETWHAQMTVEEFEEKVEKEFQNFKLRFLENLDKGENDD